jgi:hypothetical protein
MLSVLEVAKAKISRFTALTEEYEQLTSRQHEIEAELGNGYIAKAHVGRPKSTAKVEAPKAKVGRPKSTVAKKVGRPKSNGENKVNKAEAIRLYAAENKDVRPKDIIKALGEKGIEVGPAAVWQALNHVPTGKKRGRPAKAEKVAKPKVAKSEKAPGRGRREAGHTLSDVVMKILGRNKNGLTLAEIRQRVESSGYETSATDSSLSAAVQNCLAKLREKEAVSKDDETRKYIVKVA